jgi:ABC-type multidrug transport system fused ATPase/permease subunit
LKRYFKNIAATLTPGEKKRFTTLVTLNLVISIADIASLAILVYIINFYTRPATLPSDTALPHWLFNRDSVMLILLYLFLFSVKNYAAWLVHRAQCNFMAQVASRLSQKKLIKYLHGPYSQYMDIDSSIHIRKISFQPLEFCQHILDGVQQIITQSALILFAIAAILLFNAQLFLLLLVLLLPPVVIVFYISKKRIRRVRIHTRQSAEKSLQHLQEAVAGFVESNIYNKSGFFMQRFAAWQQQYHRYFADYLIAQGTPNRIIEIFALLGMTVLIAISQWSGEADAGAIVTIGAFMAAAYKIIPGIVKILNISGQMNAYEFTMQDIAEPDLVRKTNKPGIEKIESIIFNNVDFKYNGHRVLQNFNVQVKPGDFLAIAGASGKGKTTIINLMLGFLSPHKGEIWINENILATEQRHWQNISYTKQQNFLFHDTILRNIVLDDGAYDTEKLKDIICKAGLMDLIENFPEGLNKMIMENGRNISGGQRQRIVFARALYRDAGLLILDEPFNELDEKSENELLGTLKNLAASGKIVILVTHHSKSLSFCNKTVSLDV